MLRQVGLRFGAGGAVVRAAHGDSGGIVCLLRRHLLFINLLRCGLRFSLSAKGHLPCLTGIGLDEPGMVASACLPEAIKEVARSLPTLPPLSPVTTAITLAGTSSGLNTRYSSSSITSVLSELPSVTGSSTSGFAEPPFACSTSLAIWSRAGASNCAPSFETLSSFLPLAAKKRKSMPIVSRAIQKVVEINLHNRQRLGRRADALPGIPEGRPTEQRERRSNSEKAQHRESHTPSPMDERWIAVTFDPLPESPGQRTTSACWVSRRRPSCDGIRCAACPRPHTQSAGAPPPAP